VAEVSRSESEHHYRSLYENLTDGFVFCKMIFDEQNQPVDFVYLDVNQAAEKLTGLQNIAGKRVSEVLPGITNLYPQFLEIHGRVAKTGNPETFEMEIKPLNLWLSSVVYSPKRDHFAAIFTDISKKKQAEAERRNTQYELERKVLERTAELETAQIFANSVLDNIPDMIFVKDAKELRFVRLNKAAEELLGVKREELLGKNDYDVFPKAEADFFTAKDRDVLAGKMLDIPEEPIQTRSRGQRILHTKKIPIYGTHGKAEYLLGISEDITEKKEAEKNRLLLVAAETARIEAEKAVRLRDDFISIASHELKTPLTPLKMQVQLIKRHLVSGVLAGHPKSSELITLLESSNEQLNDLTRLVNDVLDVSRIRVGQLVLDINKVELDGLVQNVLNRLHSEIVRSGCSVNFRTDASVEGRWDRIRLEQAITNLMTNALKYGRGAPIDVQLDRQNESVSITVQDYGIGIEKTDQIRIFEQFGRAATIKSFSGLGLGLYITREIVVAHGGTISVESDPGNGAIFKIVLPTNL